MDKFPLDPILSKMLMWSVNLECSEEMLTIVSMLAANRTVFVRPKQVIIAGFLNALLQFFGPISV